MVTGALLAQSSNVDVIENDSSSESSEESIDLQDILKGLNIKSFEEINKKNKTEDAKNIKKKNKNLLLRLASRRR